MKDGATTTSVNTSAIAAAAGASHGAWNATIPPNADTSSHANAFAYASAGVAPNATPHGLLCFTITAAFSGSADAKAYAASTSNQLLNDISLPCRTFAPPSTPGPPTSAYNPPRWCGFSP